MVGHAKACAIAGLNVETFRTQRRRDPGLFRTEYITPQGGRGQSGDVDRLGVLFLAIFARLSAFGVPPRKAAVAAWSFTDVSDVVAYRIANGAPSYVRGPGELYPKGLTILLVTRRFQGAGDDEDFEVRLVNLLPEDTIAKALHELGFPSVGIAAMIDLNTLVAYVDAALAEPRTSAQERADQIAEIEASLAVRE